MYTMDFLSEINNLILSYLNLSLYIYKVISVPHYNVTTTWTIMDVDFIAAGFCIEGSELDENMLLKVHGKCHIVAITIRIRYETQKS